MAFQSYGFILAFLPLTVLIQKLLNRFNLHFASRIFLLAASYVFYGMFSVSFIPLLLLSTGVNFLLGRALLGQKKRLYLLLGLVFNIGLLVYFKYMNFFIGNINALFHSSLSLLKILQPVGISFFTFQQLAYIIDSYQGGAPRYSFLDYALHAAFFPYIVSGPITKHSEIIPQFSTGLGSPLTSDMLSKGTLSFAIGLFKKVIVADTFGAAANWGFSNIDQLDSLSAIVVMLSYTLQLYFDFSGYSDMACGVGHLLGVKLPQNFNSPYKALTIADFWRRWHMSLTGFLTKYLYIPLGGSRKGLVRTCINTLIVFLISGLWHGSSWTFVFWGLLHGAAIVLNRIFKEPISRLHPALSWLLTFSFVNVAWVFFRAPTIPAALSLLKVISRCEFGPLHGALTKCFVLPEFEYIGRFLPMRDFRFNLMVCLVFLTFSLFACLQAKNVEDRLSRNRLSPVLAVFCAFGAFWAVVSLSGATTFLYSDF